MFAGIGALPLLLLAGCHRTDPSLISLRDMGSFHVGGREAAITGDAMREVQLTPGGPVAKLDSNGEYSVEQMYVQYFLPAKKRGAVPMLLWHGGFLTGACYETTPDGRPGWRDYFVREGWDTYVSDAVERGRSGFAPPEFFAGEPLFLPKADPFERFRVGGPGGYDPNPAKRRALPGNQFPVEAYDAFTMQFVPRWLSNDDSTNRSYTALVDRVCPCVLVVHSQSGQWGFRVAQSRPDKVKALVLVEPAALGDAERVAALKGVPILVLWGDFIEQSPRWTTYRENTRRFAARIREAGGDVTWVDLPEAGIHGNSHMMMMDRNNLQIAAFIQKWLADRGLYR